MFIYIIYLLLFTVSTILQIDIRNYDFISDSNNTHMIINGDGENIYDIYDISEITRIETIQTIVNVVEVLLLLLTTYYIIKEITEISTITCKIWFNMWNIFDIIQYILIYSLVPLKIMNSDYQYVLLSILAPIFWIKFLYFGVP